MYRVMSARLQDKYALKTLYKLSWQDNYPLKTFHIVVDFTLWISS